MPHDLYEFHCEGGCRGYILVPIDVDEQRDVIVKCPSCGHEHMRTMKDGQITGKRHSTSKDTETVHLIEPTMSAFSKEPRLKAMESKGLLGDLWSRFAGRN